MKTTNLLSLISTALVALSQPASAAGHGGGGGGFGGGGGRLGGGGFHGGGFGGGFPRRWRWCWRFSWRQLWPPNPLQAEPGAAVVALALALPVLAAADFARPRPAMGALILPVEVVGGPTGAFRYYNGGSRHVCPLGHTNSADGETNRRGRMLTGPATRCSPAESPGVTNKAKHEDLERAAGGRQCGRKAMVKSPGVCAP